MRDLFLEHERQGLLVAAMAEKQRSLLVLDDPWMPEQVRFLNPIDGSQTEHRLLVTTRIRDLVPKATRLELPLMGKDEAVALLLDLANVEEDGETFWKSLAVCCGDLGGFLEASGGEPF